MNAFNDNVRRGYRVVEKDVLPRSLERMYASYAFTNVDNGAAFAYDSLQQWADGTERIDQLLFPLLHSLHQTDPRLASQETEFAEKLNVNWRLRGFGTVVPHGGSELSCRNKEQADELSRVFAERRAYYLERLEQYGIDGVNNIVANAAVRLDKGKGSPLWIPGTDPVGGIMLRAVAQQCATAREVVHEAERLAKGRPALVQTSYIRIQAARGPVKGWRLGPGGILEPDELAGRPKTRRIAAISFLVNHFWVPYAETLRSIMSETPNGQHAGSIEPVLREAARWPIHAALDLKSYDTTVAYETHVALREQLWLPVIKRIYSMVSPALRSTLIPPDEMAMLDEIIITMPVLTPPANPRYAAEIWPAIGQTRSGENPTSFKGTEIRRAHCIAKARHLGFKTNDHFIFNYGDDTLMMCLRDDQVTKWNDEPSFLGLNEVPAADATFLMKRVPDGYGYLGRMISASINREVTHEPSHMVAAAAAFATRRLLLNGHPLADQYYPLLRAYAGPRRMRMAVDVAEGVTGRGTTASQLEASLMLSKSAALIPESHHGSQRDDIAAAMLSLATVPGISRADQAEIRNAADEIDRGQHGQTHALSWAALDAVARRQPSAVVDAHLRKYTLGYRKPPEPEDTRPHGHKGFMDL